MQDWIKGRNIGMTMPLWTWSEMEKLVDHLYKDKVRLTLKHVLFVIPLMRRMRVNQGHAFVLAVAGGRGARPTQLSAVVWRRAAAGGGASLDAVGVTRQRPCDGCHQLNKH
jgi:hypothetical protein